MNSRRVLYILGSIISAIGMLVLLLTSLSSATAASDVPILKTTKMMDTASNRWRILADVRVGLGAPGVVALQNKIHVISGFYTPGYGNNADHYVYDPHTNTWQYLWGIFPMPRSDMVVANVGDEIYAIGGWNADLEKVYSYTHKYEPTLNEWITMTSMITPVSGAGGVVISDSIYIIGGFDGISGTRDIQIYDTISDTWSIGTPLPKGRSEFRAVVLDGLIYAVGGNRPDGDPNPSTAVVEIYDPAVDSWINGPPLPESRAAMAVEVRNGEIYVIGGTDNWSSDNVTNTTFIYDPISKQWSIGAPMPTSRSLVGSAVISDSIYVIGGVGDTSAGTANEAYGDFEIIPSFTSIVLDDPDPSQAFQPVVISYEVTSTLDIPVGVVIVTTNQNTFQCSGKLVDGSGSCEIVFDLPGVYSVTAAYGGDDFHTGSSDSESHDVAKAETTTSLIGEDPDPSLIGQPILVTFEVTSTYGLPAGMVTVAASNSQQSCTDELFDGKGSCAITLDAQGTYTITATYSGDISFASSSDTNVHQVVDYPRIFIPIILREQ